MAWAGQLTRLARNFAPNHIKAAISSRVEEKEAGQFIIRITADKKISPDARAQEYGSGLRATRGPKNKYPIRPKGRHPYIAFNWEIANAEPEKFKFLPDGRVYFPLVMHPGIKAVRYIARAVNELRRRGRAELDKTVRRAILGDIRRSFRGGK